MRLAQTGVADQLLGDADGVWDPRVNNLWKDLMQANGENGRIPDAAQQLGILVNGAVGTHSPSLVQNEKDPEQERLPDLRVLPYAPEIQQVQGLPSHFVPNPLVLEMVQRLPAFVYSRKNWPGGKVSTDYEPKHYRERSNWQEGVPLPEKMRREEPATHVPRGDTRENNVVSSTTVARMLVAAPLNRVPSYEFHMPDFDAQLEEWYPNVNNSNAVGETPEEDHKPAAIEKKRKGGTIVPSKDDSEGGREPK